jgi:hypothetical protein
VLSQLCDPNRRGKIVNWDKDDDEIEKSEEPKLALEEESLECPTDVCIVCCGLCNPPYKFPPKRKDSLRSPPY